MYKLKSLKILTLLLATVIFSACSSDDDNTVSPNEKALEELIGQWKAVKVTKDDLELAGYENFRLVITNGKVFQTYGDNELLFPIGEFESVDGRNFEAVVCNGVEVELDHDNGHLIASFTLAGESSNGRLSGVAGNYVFDMVPN